MLKKSIGLMALVALLYPVSSYASEQLYYGEREIDRLQRERLEDFQQDGYGVTHGGTGYGVTHGSTNTPEVQKRSVRERANTFDYTRTRGEPATNDELSALRERLLKQLHDRNFNPQYRDSIIYTIKHIEGQIGFQGDSPVAESPFARHNSRAKRIGNDLFGGTTYAERQRAGNELYEQQLQRQRDLIRDYGEYIAERSMMP